MKAQKGKLPREGRLLLLLAALGGTGIRPTNRKILRSVPGYPGGLANGMRALRRDLKDLARAGILPGTGKSLSPDDVFALQLLGPVAERSRRFPFREPVLRAWRRYRALDPGAGIQTRGQATLPLDLKARISHLGLSPTADASPQSGSPTVVSLGADWPGKVEFLHRAVLNRRMIGFQYLRPSRRRGFKAHTVKPYGLGLRDGLWYLAGHDEGRDAVALFRLSRMRRERTLSESFSQPAAFDMRRVLQAPAWSFGKRKILVRIKARASASEALREIPPEIGNFKRQGRGILEGSLRCGDLLELARWILPFGSDVRILSPRGAARILKREALRVART